MKKILITAAAFALAAPALAAQQDIAQISAITASREALRTAINTQLSAVQSNFDELYPIIEAGPVYVNASAPADTKVVWIDTDQDNAIKVNVSGTWTVVGTAGSGGIAHATSDGTYYASKDGAWATLAGVFQPADDDLTSAAGGSTAGSSKLFGTNSSGVVGWYDIPGAGSGISHATADGKWYGSKDGAWVDLAPTFSSALPKWIDMPVGHSFTAGDLTWYNGQVWKASGTHSKVLGEYPDAESADWEDYIQAPIVVDYPTEVGVPAWTAEGWAATSYTVGTAANNLVQLNASAQLPAVSAALLTNFPTLNQNTTGTAGGLSGTPNITVGTISAGAAGFSVDADGDVTAKSVTVTRTASPSAIDLYEGTGGGDNKLTLTLSGNLAADATLNVDQILATGDVDDTPVNNITTAPISSNWAYDHVAATDPHTGYVLESAIGTTVQGYDADLTTAAGAGAAGVNKYFGTNASSVVGFYDLPSGGGTPTTITVTDTTDTTAYVALFDSATGDLGPKTDAGLTYNAGTGMLTATGFTGPLTGTASGNLVSGGDIGAATATTPSANDNDTSVATTAFVTGEVKKKYVSGTEADFYGTLLDPQAIYAVDGTNHAVTIANNVPAAFTITEINVSCDADPTTEITLTFKHKTAGAGYGSPTTIKAVTTTNGAATITTGFDDATIPAGTKMFMTLSDPDDALKECAWQIEGDWD